MMSDSCIYPKAEGSLPIYKDRCPCPWGIILVYPRDMPSFDLHAKYALLTYAQSGDLSAQSVCDHLGTLGAECIVAREAHADGGFHLHAFVDFGRKRRFRDPRKFDVLGVHPNISPSRGTPWDGYDYAIKDGCVEAGGLGRPSEHSNTVGGESSKWDKIVLA